MASSQDNLVAKPEADVGGPATNNSTETETNKNLMEFVHVNVKSEVDDPSYEPDQPTTLFANNQINPQKAMNKSNYELCTNVKVETVNDGNSEHNIKIEKYEEQTPELLEVKIEPIIYPSSDDEEKKTSQDGYTKVNDRFNCDYCTRHFARVGNAKNHVKTHHDRKEQKKSDICQNNFRDEHNTNRPYQCDRCQKTFRAKKHVQTHIAKDFCKRFEELKCEFCGKVFSYISLYKSHLVKHETERPFSCEVCLMKFKHKSAVTRHMLQHNGVRKFECTLCDKKFFLKGLLKTHMKSHSKERPFTCHVCTKTFSMKHNLKKHLLIHKRPKKLTCDICQKTFPRESRLKYHMQVHSRDKNFACDLCNRFFSHKHNVVRHLAARHTEVLNPAFVASLKF